MLAVRHLQSTVDWEIFARKNIRLLNFHVVLFSSPWHTGSVTSFLIFDVEKFLFFIVIGYRQKFINDENFPIYGSLLSMAIFLNSPTAAGKKTHNHSRLTEALPV